MKMKAQKSKTYGMPKSISKREVYSNTILPQETKISQISNLSLHLKQLEKEEQTKLKVSRREEIIKIRAEINEREIKKTVAKINETQSWFFEKRHNIDKPDSPRKKGTGLKSIKLEMKKENLQLTSQKYKRS